VHRAHALQIQIHKLPCIAGTVELQTALQRNFKLLDGLSAETSGGLLVVLPRDTALAYCRELEACSGYAAWMIGVVVEGDGTRNACIMPDAKVIPAPLVDTPDQLW
jgi:selenide,water dikinase